MWPEIEEARTILVLLFKSNKVSVVNGFNRRSNSSKFQNTVISSTKPRISFSEPLPLLSIVYQWLYAFSSFLICAYHMKKSRSKNEIVNGYALTTKFSHASYVLLHLIYDTIIQQTFGMHVPHLDRTRRF